MYYSPQLNDEFRYSTSRSSGAGGQHVNKTETRVELYWNVWQSKILSEEEKHRVAVKLANRINAEGELILSNQTERSQLRNKTLVTLRLYELLNQALHIPKKRKPTKPSKASVKRRLKAKKQHSEKKQWRQKPQG